MRTRIPQPGKPFFGSSPGLLLEYVLDRPDTSGARFGSCAEVQDTANIHILALEHPDAGGERVLIGTGQSYRDPAWPGSVLTFLMNRRSIVCVAPDSFAWQDVYDIFNSAGFPNINAPGKSTRGAGQHKAPSVTSAAKAFKLWPDFRYHTFETSIRELGEQLVKDGYLTAVSD
jgi:hypothetical protein